MRAAAGTPAGEADCAELFAPRPCAKLPNRVDAAPAIPAFETCFKNCRLGVENCFIRLLSKINRSGAVFWVNDFRATETAYSRRRWFCQESFQVPGSRGKNPPEKQLTNNPPEGESGYG